MEQHGSLTRLVLIAAVIAGISYVASWDMAIGAQAKIVWKGAGVSLLALYAALLAKDLDGWLLTAVMVAGALGDVLLDAVDIDAGAAAFAVGHVIAIWLYFRNRRLALTPSQRALALIIVPIVVVISWSLPADRAGAAGIALYAAFLSLIAAAAWTSRFPRYRTGIGAMMFVVSDLLIFARMGPLAEAAWAGFAIWGLYFAGQTLIAIGVTQTLARDRSAP
jgi:uncharacterized membrane protein YhhN